MSVMTWGERVEKFYSRLLPPDANGCLNWTGCLRNGYGAISPGDGSPIGAHCFAWIAKFGEIPGELCVLHKCDNRKCCNTDHLFLGTRGDNNRDAKSKGRNQHGTGHWGARLKEEDAAMIKCIPYKCGWSIEIARIIGIADPMIARIRKGTRWGHVPITAKAQVAADNFIDTHLRDYKPFKNQHLNFYK